MSGFRAPVALSGDIFALQRHGGVSRIFVELQRGLVARGVRSTVLAGLHANEHLDGLPRVLGRRVERVRPGRLRPYSYRALEQLWALRHGRVGVFHKTYYSEHGPPRGPQVVVTVYDMIHERFPEEFGRDNETIRQKRAWCDRADLVLAISHSTKADLVELAGIREDKVVVTHLGVTLPDALLKPRSEGRPYVLYVGARPGYKNFDRLVRVFADMASARELSLVCFGSGPFAPEERARLARLGLRDRVAHETGDDARLAELYAGARAFVYPSLYEGFGLPPLEAMAHGCPVACSRAASLPEVVGDAAEVFDPADDESMRAALERVLTDHSRRAVLARAGREQAKRFPWDRTVEQTLAAYGRLLS